MLLSSYKQLCGVTLPYNGRQKYMHTFDLSNPIMAEGFEDYFNIVVKLCRNAGAIKGFAHMTVDGKIIPAGMSQRRPGPHIDGQFKNMNWQHPDPHPGWLHYCNNITVDRMAIIVASSVAGCKVYKGNFSGSPNIDGDLSHIADQLGKGEIVPANMGYLLSPDCVHESMIFERDTRRTFLRIALPIEYNYPA